MLIYMPVYIFYDSECEYIDFDIIWSLMCFVFHASHNDPTYLWKHNKDILTQP